MFLCLGHIKIDPSFFISNVPTQKFTRIATESAQLASESVTRLLSFSTVSKCGTALQSPVAKAVAHKRRKGSKDTPPPRKGWEVRRGPSRCTLHALDKEPSSNGPRFETSFCRGGVFIFVASNPEAKAWLTKTVGPWKEHPHLLW